MSAVGLQRVFRRTFFSKWRADAKPKYSTEATFDVKPCEIYKLDNGPKTKATINKGDALNYFRQMQVIRRLETAAGNLYKEKIIRGFCHLYSGQEAVAVGMKAALRSQDTIISGYRIHGWVYLMGVPIEAVLGELTGRRIGCARGKGGSMHMYGPNFYGGNGIVGAQVPLGAGLAFASKYNDDHGVNFALYGDGASNQGQIFEVYNMAKLWSLPCIFVCENNGYGMGTSAERSTANTKYFSRGDAVPGLRVDGMDILAVREATQFCIDYATSGKGPLVMEMVTYRYSGHSMSDPGTSYRSREEVQQVRATRDPIAQFKEKITQAGIATTEELKKIEGEVKAEVDEATKKAKAEKEIGTEELTADIYVEALGETVRNILPNQGLKQIRIGAAKNK